jgi:hypothetical protein
MHLLSRPECCRGFSAEQPAYSSLTVNHCVEIVWHEPRPEPQALSRPALETRKRPPALPQHVQCHRCPGDIKDKYWKTWEPFGNKYPTDARNGDGEAEDVKKMLTNIVIALSDFKKNYQSLIWSSQSGLKRERTAVRPSPLGFPARQ